MILNTFSHNNNPKLKIFERVGKVFRKKAIPFQEIAFMNEVNAYICTQSFHLPMAFLLLLIRFGLNKQADQSDTCLQHPAKHGLSHHHQWSAENTRCD